MNTRGDGFLGSDVTGGSVDLTLYPPNYLIWIFTHLKLCLADAIHNFNEWRLFRFDKMEVNCFQILLIDVMFYL